MFDMDRWLKRLWMVNGVLLLALLILGIGTLLVSWLSGAFGGKNAVIAADTTRGAPVKPRAVRFSGPARFGAPRVVSSSSGTARATRSGLWLGIGMNDREFYSYGGDKDSDGPMVNLIFLNGTQPGRVLLEKPAYVSWFRYPREKDDSLQRWITYRIALEDTNEDGRLDSDDRVDLYVRRPGRIEPTSRAASRDAPAR